MTLKELRLLVAHHGLVQYNPTPRLRLHPHLTPSSATGALISIIGQTAPTTPALRHRIKYRLQVRKRQDRRVIAWLEIVLKESENHGTQVLWSYDSHSCAFSRVVRKPLDPILRIESPLYPPPFQAGTSTAGLIPGVIYVLARRTNRGDRRQSEPKTEER